MKWQRLMSKHAVKLILALGAIVVAVVAFKVTEGLETKQLEIAYDRAPPIDKGIDDPWVDDRTERDPPLPRREKKP